MWVTGNSGVTLAGNTPTTNVFNGSDQIGGGSYDAAGNQLAVGGAIVQYDAEKPAEFGERSSKFGRGD